LPAYGTWSVSRRAPVPCSNHAATTSRSSARWRFELARRMRLRRSLPSRPSPESLAMCHGRAPPENSTHKITTHEKKREGCECVRVCVSDKAGGSGGRALPPSRKETQRYNRRVFKPHPRRKEEIKTEEQKIYISTRFAS